jgi:cardiolipin-specific phospholipase
MGNSSRPEWNLNKDLSEQESVFEAENFFIDALEDWRIATGISKMTILGHSLGGYLSVCIFKF